MTTVYMARNAVNGMCYVGRTKHLQKRINAHHRDARRGSNTLFHQAIRKHGESAFDWLVLEKCKACEAPRREKYWIERMGTLAPSGYNMTKGEGYPFWKQIAHTLKGVNTMPQPKPKRMTRSAFVRHKLRNMRKK